MSYFKALIPFNLYYKGNYDIFSEFWKLEVERVEGEAVLFLGPKSKHTQFGKMCLDPRNEKFKVEKEEDLQV